MNSEIFNCVCVCMHVLVCVLCHFPSENCPDTDLNVNVFLLTFDFGICYG